MKDPSIDFYKPFQSGEGTCYPLYPENYYRVPYTKMFGGKTRKQKAGKMIYSNGVDLDLPAADFKGGKRKNQKGGKSMNLDNLSNFNMFGEDVKVKLDKNFSDKNMGITYATQAGGKRKNKRGGATANEYYIDKLVGSYSPKNMASDTRDSPQKCGGGKRRKQKAGDAVNRSAGSLNAERADGTLNRMNASTAGGGIMYRDAPGANKPSNFSKGTIFHPEWRYTKGGKQRGGQKIQTPGAISDPAGAQVQTGFGDHIIKDSNDFGGFLSMYSRTKGGKQRGGQKIQTPGAIPFGVATSDPAGVQVQMGFGDHIIKGSKDLGGFLTDEFSRSLPGNMDKNLKTTMSGGKRKQRKQKGGNILTDLFKSMTDVGGQVIATGQKQMPTALQNKQNMMPTQVVGEVIGAVKAQIPPGLIAPAPKTSEISRNITATTTQAPAGRGAAVPPVSSSPVTTVTPSGAVQKMPPNIMSAVMRNAPRSTTQSGGKRRKQKGGMDDFVSSLMESAKNVGDKVKGAAIGNLPGTLKPDMAGGKKKRSQKGGENLANSAGLVGKNEKIPLPGEVPFGISTSVSQGAQDQMYGDGMTRMRGPRDILLPNLGQPSSEAIQAQMGAGKKKASQKNKRGGADSSGVGSDFAFTLMSRGPANYPDGPSADRFRYFTKTAQFIPNSMLKFAAAPISTGFQPDPNPYPMAYNDHCGGNKTKKSKAKKSRSRSTSKKSKASKSRSRSRSSSRRK